MKIQNINSYNIKYNIPESKYKKMSSQGIINDCFIKSETTTFKSSQSFAQKYEPLKKDLIIYLKNNKEIDLSKIHLIIQKYTPFLTIKNFGVYIV